MAAMDIFDSPNFRLNKKLFKILGFWPHDLQRRSTQACWFVIMMFIIAPHVTAVIVDISNMDKAMEHLCISMLIVHVFLNYTTLVFAENKMKFLFNEIGKNWLAIIDEKEKRILLEYSKRGRILTTAFMYLLLSTAAAFLLVPLVPELLNAIDPLPVPRSHIYVLNGEFLLENRDDHFFKIYLYDTASVICTVLIVLAMDPMYMVIVDQCAALYAILTYRLSALQQRLVDDLREETSSSYEWLIHTIRLHQRVLRFASNVNDSYSVCFFCAAIITIVHIPITSVVILIHLHDPVNFVRYGLVLTCVMVHVFVLCWPGQRLIDHSTRLLDDAYCNDWYETPEKTKKLLRIFMLRCSEPCVLTAGGLVEMNFEVYLKIVKTAASYITVLASFR